MLDGGLARARSPKRRLREIFRGGNSELQLLDERARILREVGATLVERYDGRFSNVLAASPLLCDDGRVPRACSCATSRASTTGPTYDGETVRFWKLAQLSVWILEATLPGGAGFADLDRLTAFADYIVPAALRVLGITRYSDELEAAVARRPADRGRVARGRSRSARTRSTRARSSPGGSTSCARRSCT